MKTSEQIVAEITNYFGYFPPFFELAKPNQELLLNLWQQTLFAYINNPLPTLFKEKLFAYLSRFCSIPYCIIHHSCLLLRLGMNACEVLQLLEMPTPTTTGIEFHLSKLTARSDSLPVRLELNSAIEASLLYCSTFIFLDPAKAKSCCRELLRILGTVAYQNLTIFLSYIKTYHNWIEAYPEADFDVDPLQSQLNTLLVDEPSLADFFRNYSQRAKLEYQDREEQLFAELVERKRKEEEARLLQSMMQAISESQSFHSALGVTLRKVCEFAGWNFGEAWIPNLDKATLQCSPAWYSTSTNLQLFRRLSEEYEFSPGVGLPGRVWVSKQIEWDKDISAMPETTYLRAQIARESGLKTGLGIPLIDGEQVLAVLVFYMFESHDEDEQLIELISALTQLGSTIQRKQAEEALRIAHDELEIRVRERTVELTKANENLIKEIVERKQVESALRQSEQRHCLSLQEKEVLLKEIHHRVKNNLQIISSLLNLQSNYLQDQQELDVFKVSQSRIESMALIHEKLYQSEDLARIEFAEYIEDLVMNLFSAFKVESDDIEFLLNIKQVFLDLDTSITCGLIINELVINSLKHAFTKTCKSRIHIAFDQDNDNKITIIVGDNGIGLSADFDFKNTQSLGLQLVDALTHQLGGSIELNRKSGTEFKITFTQKMS